MKTFFLVFSRTEIYSSKYFNFIFIFSNEVFDFDFYVLEYIFFFNRSVIVVNICFFIYVR